MPSIGTSSKQKALPTISAPNQRFAKVVVGPKAIRYVVHADLLTHHSGFFRGAFKGRFREAQERTVTLACDDVTTFQLFVHWLYYQRFPDGSKGDDRAVLDKWTHDNDKGDHKTSMLISLYLFADQYLIPKLKRDSIDGLFDHVHLNDGNNLPGTEDVHLAFDRCPADGPLCRFLVDLHCYHRPSNKSPEGQHWELPHAFLERVVYRYASLLSKCTAGTFRGQFTLRKKDYHDDESERKIQNN